MTSTESEVTPTQIDHIVLLVSPADFDNVPSWLKDNFTIIEGGTHAKGTSHNKLIIFQDGTYLELFSWVDPPPEGTSAHADFPSWADKPVGTIIDWAVTGKDPEEKYSDLIGRMKDLQADGEALNIWYDKPVEGGRTRKDGVQLRWATMRPRPLQKVEGNSNTDLGVPFFCHDLSKREARVPYVKGSVDTRPGLVSHPSQVVGIHSVVVGISISQLVKFVKLYEVILGIKAEAVQKDNGTHQQTYRFSLSSPAKVHDLGASSEGSGGNEISQASSFVELRGIDDEQAGTSLLELVLRTNASERRGECIDGRQLRTPITLA